MLQCPMVDSYWWCVGRCLVVAGIFVTGWWWVVKVKLYGNDQVGKWLASTVNLSTLWSAQITASIGIQCVDPGGMILAGRNKVKLKINQSKILLVFHSHWQYIISWFQNVNNLKLLSGCQPIFWYHHIGDTTDITAHRQQWQICSTQNHRVSQSTTVNTLWYMFIYLITSVWY